jgi:ubiquinone/menaquinone biosynthesis C-methylase UbiE
MEKSRGKEMIPVSDHKRNVAEFFSEKAKYWRLIYDPDAEGLSRYNSHSVNKRKEAVLAALDRFSGGNPIRVLDAGCGPGILLEEIAGRGHKTTGLDHSRDMVAQASRAAETAGKRFFGCVQGDLEALPFKDHAFDAVVCVGVLQYLPDDRTSVSELGRIVKPGGMAIVTLPNILRVGILFDPVYYVRGIRYVIHLLAGKKSATGAAPDSSDVGTNQMFSNRRYFFGQLRKVFRESGLESVDVRCIGFGPLTFWRKPVLPERMALSLSDRLDRASAKSGLGWLAVFSNRWVISLKKVS